ncbi:MAG: sulfurtransferase complex subunit TusB [Gammaproteobacteria bacterium]|jgi:tRNA 2-thiouridine synthesizing protein B|nr:sulfurtransferase complex subunit TusB [Gammaproteobacteria bacterium]
MTMLHTVNKSPFESKTFDTCLGLAKGGSTILLIEDGVYAATTGNSVADKIKNTSDINFCVLDADAQARGIEGKLAEGIKVIDYEGFVDLVAEHDTVQAWL